MEPAFGDPEFRQRLAKLLAMLSTENPAEAEAARLKLREHLAARRLSMIDLAQYLTAAPDEPDDDLARETERLRAANQALERAVRRSRAEALAALQRATLAERELGRRRRGPMPSRNVAAGWVAVAALAVLAAGAGAAGWTWFHGPAPHPAVLATARPPPERFASALPALPAPAPPTPARSPDRPVFSWQPEPAPSAGPAAHAAFVSIDGAPLRARASPDATLQAVLPRGLPVVVLRTERRFGQDWSLVQTPKGQGYVDTAAIVAAQ